MTIPLIQAKNLIWEIKGNTIIDVESFRIHEGEHAALIGPNGSGKSSLFKLLAYLQKPTKGEINFNALSRNKSLIDKRREMAVVFQEPLLLNMTVYDNVAYGLKLRKVKNIKGEVENWLERLKILHLKSRYPKNLSGGEAQRVSIARAMALKPKILFLDEPFTALDAPTKAQLLEEMNILIKQTSMTSLFITHEFSEIPFLADKVYAMSKGRIVQQGSLEDIFYRPINEEVADLVGADNQYEVEIAEKVSQDNYIVMEKNSLLKIRVSIKNTILLPGPRVKALIRSEDVELGSGDVNSFQGYIKRIMPFGLHYKLTLDAGIEISLIISKQQFLEINPKTKDRISINIKPNRIHLIESKDM
ncbi:MAG: hypothetical protein APF76_01225 [Desulfitibacter sp. BRH_c19]|nr:MAG: hypothetical protein APF76_01225 [Desulfitibacter sp. BRH_c19]